MSDIWLQSKFGRAVDPVDPNPDMVDFREIAETLANINRYSGCADHLQVSVAFHTLIAVDAAPEPLKPLVLCHDFHEWMIGDITTPAEHALIELTAQTYGPATGNIVKQSLSNLKFGIDVAVHKAAGLEMPTAAERVGIKTADIVALMTERRDFLVKPPKAWGSVYENTPPLPDDYRHQWAPPMDMAARLYSRMTELLPALQNKVAA